MDLSLGCSSNNAITPSPHQACMLCSLWTRTCSTSRQVLSVASIILRNLGVDSQHQVILYPDIRVHSHLKFTPVSWGPTFDPTLPVSTQQWLHASSSLCSCGS